MTVRPSSPVPVSDHAVLRWLERVEGIDVEHLRRQIAASAAVGIAHKAGAVIAGRGKIVIRDGAVITILPRHSHSRRLLGRLQVEIELLDVDLVVARKPMRRRRR